ARRAMFAQHLSPSARDGFGNPISSSELDFDTLAARTQGYTGADIKLVSKESAMRPVRELMRTLETQVNDVYQTSDAGTGVRSVLVRRVVENRDVEEAIERTRPSCDKSLADRYMQWTKDFGSV
ncbi:Katanin p60 ATPase-containing subunit A-like 2, partial [Gonapodya sp. JEL0774]